MDGEGRYKYLDMFIRHTYYIPHESRIKNVDVKTIRAHSLDDEASSESDL
jgi:hypothetical protein